MSFRLLFLPLLCIDCVLEQLDLIDLIDISQLSRRCFRLFRRIPPHLTGFRIQLTETHVSIMLDNKNDLRGKWVFNCSNLGRFGPWIFESFGFTLKINGSKIFYKRLGENPQISVKNGIDFLTNLYKIPIKKVILFVDTLPNPCILLLQQCELLQISGKNLMENDVLRRILEQISVTYELLIDIPTNPDFKFDLSNFKKVNCAASVPWLTSELALNSSIVCLYNSHWNLNDCVHFVTKWFNSENTTFEFLKLRWKSDIVGGQINLDHLNTIPFCKTRRSEYILTTPTTGMRCTDGIDILRRDGLLATAEMRDNFFVFYVFHDRFPDFSSVELFE